MCDIIHCREKKFRFQYLSQWVIFSDSFLACEFELAYSVAGEP